MAGPYADPPAPRLAWDIDGSIFFLMSGSTPTLRPQAEMDALNSEDGGHVLQFGPWSSRTVGILFPEPRDIYSYVLTAWWDSNPATYAYYSKDTTNGGDGTWLAMSGQGLIGHSFNNLRTQHQVVNQTEVKGMRWYVYHNDRDDYAWKTIHLYGSPSPANPENVSIWDPTLDQPVPAAHFDWGDAERNNTLGPRSFRVKNRSLGGIAPSVTVTTEVKSTATPPFSDMVQYSQDGGTTWVSSITLGDMAPGAVSGIIQVRVNLDAAAVLGLRWWRTVAKPNPPV